MKLQIYLGLFVMLLSHLTNVMFTRRHANSHHHSRSMKLWTRSFFNRKMHKFYLGPINVTFQQLVVASVG